MLSTNYKKSLLETVLDTFMHITRKPKGRDADFEIQYAIDSVENRLEQLMELQTRLVKIQHQHNLQCESKKYSSDDRKVEYTPVDVTLRSAELTDIISTLDLTTDLAHIVRRGMQELQNDKARDVKSKYDRWSNAISNSQK